MFNSTLIKMIEVGRHTHGVGSRMYLQLYFEPDGGEAKRQGPIAKEMNSIQHWKLIS